MYTQVAGVHVHKDVLCVCTRDSSCFYCVPVTLFQVTKLSCQSTSIFIPNQNTNQRKAQGATACNRQRQLPYIQLQVSIQPACCGCLASPSALVALCLLLQSALMLLKLCARCWCWQLLCCAWYCARCWCLQFPAVHGMLCWSPTGGMNKNTQMSLNGHPQDLGGDGGGGEPGCECETPIECECSVNIYCSTKAVHTAGCLILNE